MTLYEITEDLKAIDSLLENAVDEEGNARELTEEENETLKEFFTISFSDFEKKFENYCKYIKNMTLTATQIDDVRKIYKSELDRLAKRAKAANNRADSLKSMLRFCMDNLKVEKYKTDLFTANIQNGQKTYHLQTGTDISKIPEEYLKPREIDTNKIKEAVKSGELVVCTDNTIDKGKVSTKDGLYLGLVELQGKHLVIR